MIASTATVSNRPTASTLDRSDQAIASDDPGYSVLDVTQMRSAS